MEEQPPVGGEGAIELAAAINSFNRRQLLEKAITSLSSALRKVPFGSAIVVFDAGSNDGSREFLDDWKRSNPQDNLTIVRPGHGGTSFSDGVNAACSSALTQFPGCRWLLLFETDNWVSDAEPISRAIALLQRQPRLAAAGFTVRKHNGSYCGYGMRFPSFLSLALGPNLALLWNLHPPNESPWQVSDAIRWRLCDIVFTSPLVIRREAWEQVGGFDADSFPFSDSDLDWAWRSAKAGWKIAVIASDGVVHDNLEQASAWSANRAVDFHRSRFRLLSRHRGRWAALLKPVLFLRHCAEALALAWKARSDPIANGKLQKRRQMLRSVWADYG